MWRKIAIIVPTLFFALGVLFASILRTAAVRYDFRESPKLPPQEVNVLGEKSVEIDYYLAYPGKVLPDSPFWPVKTGRDRIWLAITTNPTRRAELLLLFADKRLGSAKILFEKGKPEIAYSTLTKAEKYLEQAAAAEIQNRERQIDTSEFLQRLAKASLKHFEVMEYLLTIVPEDVRPGIIQTEDYAKRVYTDTRNRLLESGITPPENPFEWK